MKNNINKIIDKKIWNFDTENITFGPRPTLNKKKYTNTLDIFPAVSKKNEQIFLVTILPVCENFILAPVFFRLLPNNREFKYLKNHFLK